MFAVPPVVDSGDTGVRRVQLGANVTLKCKTEAFPPSENFWTYSNHETISSGDCTVTMAVWRVDCCAQAAG